MSQQEMHYNEPTNHQAKQSYAAYDGLPPHNQSQSQFDISYGQKLSPPTQNQIPSPGQRLALAIVSLGMMMGMIFGLIGIGIATNVSAGGTFGLIFVLILFFSAVVVVNALFNRKY
jgi:hypothetical protein